MNSILSSPNTEAEVATHHSKSTKDVFGDKISELHGFFLLHVVRFLFHAAYFFFQNSFAEKDNTRHIS